jgi:hypothetical protein
MDVERRRGLGGSRTEWEFTHLPLDSAEIAAVAAGDDAFLEYLVEDRFMEGLLPPRGK